MSVHSESPALPLRVVELRVPRSGAGRPRRTPDARLADETFSARAHLQELRSRGITAVIPAPADRIGHRKERGCGGRPVSFDADRYVVERGSARLKDWRGLATRYDEHVAHHRGRHGPRRRPPPALTDGRHR